MSVYEFLAIATVYALAVTVVVCLIVSRKGK